MEATRRTPRVRSFPAAPEPNAARARGFPTALESRCSRCGAGRRRGAHHPHPAPSRGGTRGERGKERKKGRGGLFLYCVLSGFSLGSSPGLVAMRGFGMDARGVERRESGREAESGRNARGVGRGEGRPVGRARLCPPRPAAPRSPRDPCWGSAGMRRGERVGPEREGRRRRRERGRLCAWVGPAGLLRGRGERRDTDGDGVGAAAPCPTAARRQRNGRESCAFASHLSPPFLFFFSFFFLSLFFLIDPHTPPPPPPSSSNLPEIKTKLETINIEHRFPNDFSQRNASLKKSPKPLAAGCAAGPEQGWGRTRAGLQWDAGGDIRGSTERAVWAAGLCRKV